MYLLNSGQQVSSPCPSSYCSWRAKCLVIAHLYIHTTPTQPICSECTIQYMDSTLDRLTHNCCFLVLGLAIHLPTYLPPLQNTLKEQSQRLVTFETFDQSDEETWLDQKYTQRQTYLPTYLPPLQNTLKEQSKRLVTFETLITILTIENLKS